MILRLPFFDIGSDGEQHVLENGLQRAETDQPHRRHCQITHARRQQRGMDEPKDIDYQTSNLNLTELDPPEPRWLAIVAAVSVGVLFLALPSSL